MFSLTSLGELPTGFEILRKHFYVRYVISIHFSARAVKGIRSPFSLMRPKNPATSVVKNRNFSAFLRQIQKKAFKKGLKTP